MEFLSGTRAKHQEGISDAQLLKVQGLDSKLFKLTTNCFLSISLCGGLCDGYDCTCVESLVVV